MMTKCRSLCRRLASRERGAAAVEYAMIVALASVAAALASGPFGDALNALIRELNEAVAGV